MSSKKSETYHTLSEEGPQPIENLSVTISDREQGVWVFNPEPTMHCRGVAYLPESHDTETVLRMWLDLNDFPADGGPSNWELHNEIADHDDNFRDIATEILGPFERHENTADRTPDTGGECPICGEEYSGHLPAHFPCE